MFVSSNFLIHRLIKMALFNGSLIWLRRRVRRTAIIRVRRTAIIRVRRTAIIRVRRTAIND